MERVLPTTEETSKPRGRPFQPGNPGRPRGSKNKTTRMVEELMADNAETIAKKLVELARNGNVDCIKLILKHVAPQRNGRPIDFNLPPINGGQDFVPAIAAIIAGISDGILTPEEGSQLAHFLKCSANIITTYDLALRVEALEWCMKEKIDEGQH